MIYLRRSQARAAPIAHLHNKFYGASSVYHSLVGLRLGARLAHRTFERQSVVGACLPFPLRLRLLGRHVFGASASSLRVLARRLLGHSVTFQKTW